MKKVIVFSNFSDGLSAACTNTETDANDWLETHPDATILASHTNQLVEADGPQYHFTLTLIVEFPDESTTQALTA
jgi:hypothetical protein